MSNHFYTARYTLRQRINLQRRYTPGYCSFFFLAVFALPKLLRKMRIKELGAKKKFEAMLCQVAHRAVAYPVCVGLSDKRHFFSPLDGMLIHRRVSTRHLSPAACFSLPTKS